MPNEQDKALYEALRRSRSGQSMAARQPLSYEDNSGVEDLGAIGGGIGALASGMGDAAGSGLMRLMQMAGYDADRARYDRDWHTPMVTSDQISEAVQARPRVPPENLQQLMHARPLNEAPPEGWHPPQAWPNQPRKLEGVNKQNKPAPSRFTAADLGQSPSATPLPSREQRAMMNGALRLPPLVAPQKASPQDMMDLPYQAPVGFGPGAKKGSFDLAKPEDVLADNEPVPFRETPETDASRASDAYWNKIDGGQDAPEPDDGVVRVTPSSYFGSRGIDRQMASPPPSQGFEPPEDPRFTGTAPMGPSPAPAAPRFMQDDPEPIFNAPEEEPASLRGPDDPREKLKAYLDRQNSPELMGQQRDQNDRLAQMMQGSEQANGRMGLYKLLMGAANQAGSVGGGHIASTEPFHSFADAKMKQNNSSMDRLSRQKESEKKAQDDKLKGMMFLARQAQEEDKYKSDLGFRGKQLEQLTKYQTGQLANTRDSNTQMNQYHNDLINATSGRDNAKLLQGDKKLGLEGQRLSNDAARQAATLEENKRHNRAVEDNTAKANAARAAQAKVKAHGVSQGAAKTDMFRKRMENANAGFDKLSATQGFDATNTKDTLAGMVPFVGNSLVSKNRQLQDQFQQEFVQATLRDESGATIGTDEYNKNMKKYFPVYGDSKETILRKAATRKADIKTLMESYNAQKGEAAAMTSEFDDTEQPAAGGGSFSNAPVMKAGDLP